jgi:hypothetical protein
MGWSVQEMRNTVEISTEVAETLIKKFARYIPTIYQEDNPTPDELLHRGKLYFSEDHMEHIDWLGQHEDILPTLAALKVKGDICFGSLEGDNAGAFWGYRFDGEGGLKRLTGDVVWRE